MMVYLVDLVGIEPTTSSMPWKRAPKLRHRPTSSGGCNFTILAVAGGIRQSALADRVGPPHAGAGLSATYQKRSCKCQKNRRAFEIRSPVSEWRWTLLRAAACLSVPDRGVQLVVPPSVAFLRVEVEGAIGAAL